MMDEKRLSEIRQRVEAASPGPWVYDTHMYYEIHKQADDPDNVIWIAELNFNNEAVNGPFIANARQDIPDLLDALDAERERADKLQAEIKRLTDLALKACDEIGRSYTAYEAMEIQYELKRKITEER